VDTVIAPFEFWIFATPNWTELKLGDTTEVETKRFGVVAKSVLKRRVSNPVVASPD
jgi:hypothetical protein